MLIKEILLAELHEGGALFSMEVDQLPGGVFFMEQNIVDGLRSIGLAEEVFAGAVFKVFQKLFGVEAFEHP